jgi:transcriptional regulator with XRE-family HTH domain
MDLVKKGSLADVTSQSALSMARRRVQAGFLRAYRAEMGPSDAKLCRELGISPKTLSEWKAKDTLFKLKYLEVEEEVRTKRLENMERELYRRAVEGVEMPLVSMGKVVDVVQKYSDTLLLAALKAENAKKYEKQERGMTLEFGDGDKHIKAYVGFNPDDV